MKSSSWKFEDQPEFVGLDLITCRAEARAAVDSFKGFYIESIPPVCCLLICIVRGFDFIYQNDEHWFAERRQNTSTLSFAGKLNFRSH